jgi:hypothetical protein
VIQRALILGVMAVTSTFADASADVFDLFASMSAALSANNASGFMKAIDVNIPDRDHLSANVNAIVEQAEVTCAIDVIKDDGDDRKRTVTLDWSMQLKHQGDDLQIERRREAVTFTVVREAKKWRITSIAPLTVFAPPNFR